MSSTNLVQDLSPDAVKNRVIQLLEENPSFDLNHGVVMTSFTSPGNGLCAALLISDSQLEVGDLKENVSWKWDLASGKTLQSEGSPAELNNILRALETHCAALKAETGKDNLDQANLLNFSMTPSNR